MSYNLVDPTTGDLTQVAGGINTAIIPANASASNKLATATDVAANTAAIETIDARLNSTTRVARMLQNELAVVNKNKIYAFSLIRGATTGQFRPYSFVFWGGYLTVNDTVNYYVEGSEIAIFKAIARDGDNFTIQNVSPNAIDIIQLNP